MKTGRLEICRKYIVPLCDELTKAGYRGAFEFDIFDEKHKIIAGGVAALDEKRLIKTRYELQNQ